jgi:sulfopropanediol 3-dehydrogenase
VSDLHPSLQGRYLKSPAPSWPSADVEDRVREILRDVKRRGVRAVREWSGKLDGWEPESFLVTRPEIDASISELEPGLKRHMEYAIRNVRSFAVHQRATLHDLELEIAPGILLGHRLLPVRQVGAYVPGGRYPLVASAFMTVVTAKAADVDRVVAVAPPQRETGKLSSTQLAAMAMSGATEIYAVGGVQALAAIAFGVEGFGEPVDLIVGAGNAYVTEAKRQLYGHVGIDALAGPTEITIIADETASAEIVALDLLGQAEHGPTTDVALITTSAALADEVIRLIPRQLHSLATADIASAAWRDRGAVILCDDPESAIAVANWNASEHLEVHTSDPEWYFQRLSAYGTVLLGPRPTVAYSDKANGANHILPTGRSARYTGGLWVGTFLRVLTHQRMAEGAARQLAEATVAISEAEGMVGHAESARRRLDW